MYIEDFYLYKGSEYFIYSLKVSCIFPTTYSQRNSQRIWLETLTTYLLFNAADWILKFQIKVKKNFKRLVFNFGFFQFLFIQKIIFFWRVYLYSFTCHSYAGKIRFNGCFEKKRRFLNLLNFSTILNVKLDLEMKPDFLSENLFLQQLQRKSESKL